MWMAVLILRECFFLECRDVCFRCRKPPICRTRSLTPAPSHPESWTPGGVLHRPVLGDFLLSCSARNREICLVPRLGASTSTFTARPSDAEQKNKGIAQDARCAGEDYRNAHTVLRGMWRWRIRSVLLPRTFLLPGVRQRTLEHRG